MRVDISGFELHNLVREQDHLRVRRALISLKTPTAGTVNVGAFSVESPFTTEVWYYVFEQSTTDGTTTLRVFTEEFFEVFNYPLGVLQKDPVITSAVQYGQLVISSPAFSFTLYGIVGGGLVTAAKTPSINPDTTALDVPVGHVCTFGDRTPVAVGNIVFVNDPPAALGQNFDPRTYVGQNAIVLPGSVYDVFQADDGLLRMFTSNGVWSVPSDAIGQGQQPQGFLARIPGIDTMRSRNAIASGGLIVVLQKDGILLMQGASSTKVDIAPYKGRRNFSRAVDVDDLRLSAQLFATSDGFICAFRGARSFFLHANINTKTFSYVTSTNNGTSMNVVGTLRTRDGETLVVLSDRIVAPWMTGGADYDGAEPSGVAAGRLDLEGARPVLRRVTVRGDAVGQGVSAYVGGQGPLATSLLPALTGEAVIDTSVWNPHGTQEVLGRAMRSLRKNINTRLSDANIEVVMFRADRKLDPAIDVDTTGQGAGVRRDKFK